jgi:hypothetical protein
LCILKPIAHFFRSVLEGVPQGFAEAGGVRAGGFEGDAAALVVEAVEVDEEVVGGEDFEAALGPFDHEDAVGGLLAEVEVVDLEGVFEAVEVGVVEAEAAGVLGDEDEGGTVDPGVDLEAAAESLRETGLAGAEVTLEEDDVAGLDEAAGPLAKAARSLFAAGLDGDAVLSPQSSVLGGC